MAVPAWANKGKLLGHFRKHGSKFPYATVQEYEDSSLETVNLGTQFTYTDSGTGAPHIGYYDKGTNRFTGVTGNGRRIVTHYPPDRGEKYVQELLDSTYT
jgi:pyocin large subunit-like protein